MPTWVMWRPSGRLDRPTMTVAGAVHQREGTVRDGGRYVPLCCETSRYAAPVQQRGARRQRLTLTTSWRGRRAGRMSAATCNPCVTAATAARRRVRMADARGSAGRGGCDCLSNEVGD